ncbi:hypothetical protein [Maritimibacter dapengensis]|uniref:Uncharacterized protein n=1 Tax=Maritimibacter dapengensis TaxID=2836868 RepID=A0ABS6T4N4_9RHOB|nr:hypothetical protein [Maritimibacter dapengensis]MBV7380211.1 hypothetical protein [Maritimibacter dapengensis]
MTTPADAQEIAHIKSKLDAEIAGYDPATADAGFHDLNAARFAEFKAALIEPKLMEVNLPGGITDHAWAVTTPKGPYRVFWLPWSDVFSLAVESKFGPCDISVHGDAIGCYASV